MVEKCDAQRGRSVATPRRAIRVGVAWRRVPAASVFRRQCSGRLRSGAAVRWRFACVPVFQSFVIKSGSGPLRTSMAKTIQGHSRALHTFPQPGARFIFRDVRRRAGGPFSSPAGAVRCAQPRGVFFLGRKGGKRAHGLLPEIDGLTYGQVGSQLFGI